MTTTHKTHDDLAKFHPCSEGLDYAQQHKSLADAWDNCERSDWMIWGLRKFNLLNKSTSVKLAVKFAQRVLHFYEGKYPGNMAPREAIEAALAWLEDPTEDNRQKALVARRTASDAAYAAAAADAADAADAAYAAAYAAAAAAYAAAAAAYAAAAAAAAAAYAAYAAAAAAAAAAAYAAAAYAAAAARKIERKAQADIIREVIPNPFR